MFLNQKYLKELVLNQNKLKIEDYLNFQDLHFEGHVHFQCPNESSVLKGNWQALHQCPQGIIKGSKKLANLYSTNTIELNRF